MHSDSPLEGVLGSEWSASVGVDISGTLVALTDEHERCINTSTWQAHHSLHLTYSGERQMPVSYLFSRHRSRPARDSAAFIYALKQRGDYQVSRADVISLARRAIALGTDAMRGRPIDGIVAMPTTSAIVLKACRFLSARLDHQPPILHILRKNTLDEVLSLLPAANAVTIGIQNDLERFRLALSRKCGRSPIAMKHVPVRLRRHVTAIACEAPPRGDHIRLLVVDDVIATGSSFSPGGYSHRQPMAGMSPRRPRDIWSGHWDTSPSSFGNGLNGEENGMRAMARV